MKLGSTAVEDVHRQSTAVCHFLFTNSSNEQVGSEHMPVAHTSYQFQLAMVRQQMTVAGWSVVVQLAACCQNAKLVQDAAKRVVDTRNAAVYVSALQVGI